MTILFSQFGESRIWLKLPFEVKTFTQKLVQDKSDDLEPKMNENDLNVVDRFKGQKMSSYEMSSDAMSVSIIITGISAHHWGPLPPISRGGYKS